jgi:hypothetical protein
MTNEHNIEDIHLGLELNLMTQEQVVSEFRSLVSKDLGMAAIQYDQFAQKLELSAFEGNAQTRSLAGGPDSSSRAELIDIMVGNYASASNEVKEKIIELAVKPLLRDNSFYVSLAIARMKNPHVIADIIRKYPLVNPGLDFYEQDLLKGDNLASAGHIQEWLNLAGADNFFVATSIALQTSNAADVAAIINANLSTFEGAAHIVASYHDTFADRKILHSPDLNKSELLDKYRSSFVGDFATMINIKTKEANWLTTF